MNTSPDEPMWCEKLHKLMLDGECNYCGQRIVNSRPVRSWSDMFEQQGLQDDCADAVEYFLDHLDEESQDDGTDQRGRG